MRKWLIVFLAILIAPVSAAAVTCGSNQWCCKHDIGGTGECLKCCNKGNSSSVQKNLKFVCVQLPTACSSNSDCTCSGCCGQLGEGGPKLCQPNC